MKKQENGITLIALVITIIVMLILTGVTINLLLDDDGIITKAMQVGKLQEKAEQDERLELLMASLKMDELMSSASATNSNNDYVYDDVSEFIDFLVDLGLVKENADVDDYMVDNSGDKYTLQFIKENSSGNEQYVRVVIECDEDGKITIENMEILSGIEKEIAKIDNDIRNNPEDYTTQGTDNGDREEKWKARVIKLYSDNGLEIEEGYINEDGTDFGDKVEVGGSVYTMEFTIACSKDGERMLTKVLVRNLDGLQNQIVGIVVL